MKSDETTTQKMFWDRVEQAKGAISTIRDAEVKINILLGPLMDASKDMDDGSLVDLFNMLPQGPHRDAVLKMLDLEIHRYSFNPKDTGNMKMPKGAFDILFDIKEEDLTLITRNHKLSKYTREHASVVLIARQRKGLRKSPVETVEKKGFLIFV